jgi:hypothetical protein
MAVGRDSIAVVVRAGKYAESCRALAHFGVGAAALTCECVRNQRAEAQLNAKREHLTGFPGEGKGSRRERNGTPRPRHGTDRAGRGPDGPTGAGAGGAGWPERRR